MQITQASESDLIQIASLFLTSFGDSAPMYPVRKPSNFVVAKEGDSLIGSGAIFKSSLHGQVPRVAIAVAPTSRRQGLGSKLHQAILDLKPEAPLGIDGCCYSTDSTALEFMKSLGYISYLDCWIPIIDLTAGLANVESPADLKIETLQQAYDNGIDHKDVLNFLVTKYIDSHHWSPVTIEASSPDWEEIAFEAVDPMMSTIILDENKIVGVSTGWLEKDILQIKWPFAEATAKFSEYSALKSLLDLQFKLALGKNATKATLECDSTEKSMSRLPEDVKVLEFETWCRLRYKSS